MADTSGLADTLGKAGTQPTTPAPAAKRTPKAAATLAAGGWLADAQIRSLLQHPGKHRIGPRTTLVCDRPGRADAEWRYTLNGRQRYMGLGPWPATPLAELRRKVEAAEALLRQGIDPLEQKASERKAAQATASRAVTFADAAERFITGHEAGWRNAKHRAQWRASLKVYAMPLAGMPVADIDAADVLRVLTPIWNAKPETASRVRGRIEMILDDARVRGLRSGPNPAAWRSNLALTLPARARVRAVKHHAALPWQELPAFMATLRQCDGMGARALEFAILVAARSGEVRGARWSEIDLDARLWIVPGSRMKSGRPHRVPLSDAALAVVRAVAPLREGVDGLCFPGMKRGRPLSDMTLLAVLKRLGRGDLTAHGMRSCFRDWAAESGKPADVAEAALAHTVGSKTQAAYQRSDLLERRRSLMAEWGAFALGNTVM
jgi:integrase